MPATSDVLPWQTGTLSSASQSTTIGSGYPSLRIRTTDVPFTAAAAIVSIVMLAARILPPL